MSMSKSLSSKVSINDIMWSFLQKNFFNKLRSIRNSKRKIQIRFVILIIFVSVLIHRRWSKKANNSSITSSLSSSSITTQKPSKSSEKLNSIRNPIRYVHKVLTNLNQIDF
ncbi:DFP1 [Sarcoptes scabiei]|nr:DFP1 [Sarcoptes scabiei]